MCGDVNFVALREAFAGYAATLIGGSFDVGEVLDRLTDHCIDVLGVAGAGVALANEDRTLYFATASDGRANKVEQAQIRLGDGPCYHAFRSGQRVVVTDLQVPERWPSYAKVGLSVGYRSVVGVPMPLKGGETVGALNLYAEHTDPWTAAVLDTASLLANMATGYLLMRQTIQDARTVARQLEHALASRIAIEQAKGVLAERHAIDPDQAFERLRDYARERRLRVHAVASDVLSGNLDPVAQHT